MTSTDAQPNQNANESTPTAPRSRGPRITLAICLAAGIAAGIGLARPGGTANDGATTAAAAEQSQQADGAGYDADDAGGADNAAPAAVAAAGAIDIADFAFGDPISVAAGSTITVTNRDGAPHTVTSDDGLFDTGSLGGGQATTIAAPTEPGTYSFFCSIHPSMQGSFTVTQ